MRSSSVAKQLTETRIRQIIQMQRLFLVTLRCHLHFRCRGHIQYLYRNLNQVHVRLLPLALLQRLLLLLSLLLQWLKGARAQRLVLKEL
jgi:hypothetical protein